MRHRSNHFWYQGFRLYCALSTKIEVRQSSFLSVIIHYADVFDVQKNKQNIILVDDEPALCSLCFEILQSDGYEVFNFLNAEDVLKSQLPVADLLITDVGLTDKSGPQLAAELNQRLLVEQKPQIPVLFVSGAEQNNIVVAGLETSSVFYLTKPFTIEDLLSKVETIFKRDGVRKVAS